MTMRRNWQPWPIVIDYGEDEITSTYPILTSLTSWLQHNKKYKDTNRESLHENILCSRKPRTSLSKIAKNLNVFRHHLQWWHKWSLDLPWPDDLEPGWQQQIGRDAPWLNLHHLAPSCICLNHLAQACIQSVFSIFFSRCKTLAMQSSEYVAVPFSQVHWKLDKISNSHIHSAISIQVNLGPDLVSRPNLLW